MPKTEQARLDREMDVVHMPKTNRRSSPGLEKDTWPTLAQRVEAAGLSPQQVQALSAGIPGTNAGYIQFADPVSSPPPDGMTAGQWLSDGESGFRAALMNGGAAFAACILPALPYAFGTGPAAVAESVVICCLIGVIVAALRPMRGFGMALAETFGILLAIFAVVLACGLFLPGGTA